MRRVSARSVATALLLIVVIVFVANPAASFAVPDAADSSTVSIAPTSADGVVDAFGRPAAGVRDEVVVMLHGLGRTGRALWLLRRRLEAAGHVTYVVSYASTERSLADLAGDLDRELRGCCRDAQLNFVTHSMGGILLRFWLAEHPEATTRLGRVVMLSPPNHGTALVDALGRAGHLLGPSGRELGTHAMSVPNRLNELGPVGYELGIIAGVRSWSPLTSWILAGPDDGTVSVASARLAGMRDFLTHPSSHSFLMYDREVARQVVHFLGHGCFEDGSCSDARAASDRARVTP
jgi:pimeloyl-ACP methyl ester carboxylesterase